MDRKLPQKRWCLSAKPHVVTSEKIAIRILIIMRSSVPIREEMLADQERDRTL
jgi:hypothetical protein